MLPGIGRARRVSCRLQRIVRHAVQQGRFPKITYAARPVPDAEPSPTTFVWLDNPYDLDLFAKSVLFRHLREALLECKGQIYVAVDPGEVQWGRHSMTAH